MIDSYGIDAEGHVWVGIDPGITTGWAILSDDGRNIGRGTFVEENLRDGLDELIRGIHRSGMTITAVIERMPPGTQGDLARRLEAVRATVTELICDVYDLPTQFILPGEWKTSRAAKTATPHPDSKTQHEIDAAMMTLYAIGKALRRKNAR